MKKALYCGIFLDTASTMLLAKTQNVTHSRQIRDMHCTFAFKPSEAELAEFTAQVGKPVDIDVVGYGCNEENSGFSVAIPSELMYLYHGCKQPHITVSIAENGRAVNTGSLDFHAVASFKIHGTVGICYDNGIVA